MRAKCRARRLGRPNHVRARWCGARFDWITIAMPQSPRYRSAGDSGSTHRRRFSIKVRAPSRGCGAAASSCVFGEHSDTHHCSAANRCNGRHGGWRACLIHCGTLEAAIARRITTTWTSDCMSRTCSTACCVTRPNWRAIAPNVGFKPIPRRSARIASRTPATAPTPHGPGLAPSRSEWD